ncbi:MAG: hypothetical protein WAV56_03765 [Microgenomates group bacterium]
MSTKIEAVEARGGVVLQMETARLNALKEKRGLGFREYFWELGELLENTILLMMTAKDERNSKEMEDLALWSLLVMEDRKKELWEGEPDTLVQARTAFLDEAVERGFYNNDGVVQSLEASRDGATYMISLVRFKALFNFFTAAEENLAARRNTLKFLLGTNMSIAEASWEAGFWGGVLSSLKLRQSFDG